MSVELEKNPVPSTFFQQLPLPRPPPQSVVLSGSSSCFPGGPGWKGTWSAPSTQSLPFGLTGLSLCFQPTTDRHPTSLPLSVFASLCLWFSVCLPLFHYLCLSPFLPPFLPFLLSLSLYLLLSLPLTLPSPLSNSVIELISSISHFQIH